MNLILDEPHEEYHSKRGLFMTSHLLIAAFAGELEKDLLEPRSDTSSYYFGRAAHVHLLEGTDAYEQQYTVGGPINKKTGKTYQPRSQKFKEWAHELDCKEPVTPEEHELIRRMTASVKRKNAAQQLLRDGKPEVTARTEIAGVPCQVRLDWLTSDWRIADYKTTRDINTFAIDCDQYGYIIQQAFYRQCIEQATGHACECYLIACEKTPNATAVVWRLDEDQLEEQQQKNEQKLIEIREQFQELREKKKCQ